MFKKVLASSVLLTVAFSSAYAETVEIDCSSDPVFSANSCNQCFDWGVKSQWEYIWLMSDVWKNDTTYDKLFYKEMNLIMPEMVNLAPSNVGWSQVPSSDGFWEHTSDLEALYSNEYDWYVLPAWQQVTWLKSKLDAAYSLDKNDVAAGWNIWLLVYPIVSWNILPDWEISTEFSEHKECVLYKSGEQKQTITTPPPTTLPQTWPAEFFLLLILAMVLGFGILKFRSSAN